MKIDYKADNAKMIQKNVRMFMAKHQHQPYYKTENSRERIDDLNSMHKCIVCCSYFALFAVHNEYIYI